MIQTSAYGRVYANVGGAAAGAATYRNQRQNVTFAQYVEQQKLNLQKRNLDMQEASMAAKREDSERSLQLAEMRFELERQRLDNDYSIRQQERDAVAERYRLAMEDREYQRAKENEELALRRAAADRENRRIGLEERRLDMAVKRNDENNSASSSKIREKTVSPKFNGIDDLISEYSYDNMSDDERYVRFVIGAFGDKYGQSLSGVEDKVSGERKPYSVSLDGLNIELPIAKKDNKGNYNWQEHRATINNMLDGIGTEEERKSHRHVNKFNEIFERFKNKQDKAASVLSSWNDIAALNPELQTKINAAFIRGIDWRKVPVPALDTFEEYLSKGDFSNDDKVRYMKEVLSGKLDVNDARKFILSDNPSEMMKRFIDAKIKR